MVDDADADRWYRSAWAGPESKSGRYILYLNLTGAQARKDIAHAGATRVARALAYPVVAVINFVERRLVEARRAIA